MQGRLQGAPHLGTIHGPTASSRSGKTTNHFCNYIKRRLRAAAIFEPGGKGAGLSCQLCGEGREKAHALCKAWRRAAAMLGVDRLLRLRAEGIVALCCREGKGGGVLSPSEFLSRECRAVPGAKVTLKIMAD